MHFCKSQHVRTCTCDSCTVTCYSWHNFWGFYQTKRWTTQQSSREFIIRKHTKTSILTQLCLYKVIPFNISSVAKFYSRTIQQNCYNRDLPKNKVIFQKLYFLSSSTSQTKSFFCTCSRISSKYHLHEIWLLYPVFIRKGSSCQKMEGIP